MPTENAALPMPPLDELRPRTITEQVYDVLYHRVINLTLPPGAKLSEAEVAAQLGVSRQPVRDAFYRLSQLGLISIRPQRATVVTQISEEAIWQAYFIRLALEIACVRKATHKLTGAQLAALNGVIARQEAAIEADDRRGFHALDDQFHRDICAYTGLEFVWTLVKDNKGHMDRARWLSLSYNARNAMEEHKDILGALQARDEGKAVAATEKHLSRIGETLDRLRSEQPDMLGK